MHLITVKEDKDWAFSRWELTYPVGWDNILSGVSALFEYYKGAEILADGKRVNVRDREDIMKVPEDANMTIRGLSTIIQVPISITFYNQVKDVSVTVAKAKDEFKNITYESFNHSLCQFLDSVELKMY
ncbi:MAG: hypothetical protein II712_00885 [Erysipelotrichaceae bacterium]|nr:hypothetical protein [Erysipelotrichaceae bacterium]